MSIGNLFNAAGLSAAATILLTMPGQVQANLTYRYVEQPKENNGSQPAPLIQVQSLEFKTVENK
ncbi:TPA: hypothetical protein QHW57_004937 [Escherichia coli]|uniref:hypothetical protein n=1 Tax=Enterobacteriaceae TaxID=543 RepID=UPI0021BFE1BA|nr:MULTISPECIES: hypothetical protein [Enterobacteriaceae]MCT9817934.1 hypothetical protein [Escherichia coli]MDM3136959.1 hypothetical protein [Citrobacter sp. Cf123]HDS6762432.1 hypothetical protein [Escherichia coli]